MSRPSDEKWTLRARVQDRDDTAFRSFRVLNPDSMKLGRALSTGWVAAALLAGFETLWVLVLERAQPVGYFALTAGLLIGAATLVAFAFSFTKTPSPWIAATVTGMGAFLAWGPASALIVCAALALLLRFGMDPKARASLIGTAVAVGLGFAVIVAPRLLARIPSLQDVPEATNHAILAMLLIFVVWVVVTLCERVSRRSTERGRMIEYALALGFLSLAALPYLSQDHPDQGRPPEEPRSLNAQAPPTRPHVVLLVLDTVRADHLTLYGYDRPTTPRLEAFFAGRRGAAIFPSFFANANWTVPSHASLLTGLPPSGHGAHFGSGSRTQFSLGLSRGL